MQNAIPRAMDGGFFGSANQTAETWILRAADEGVIPRACQDILRAIVRLGRLVTLEDGRSAYVVERDAGGRIGEDAIARFARMAVSTVRRAIRALERLLCCRFRIWRKDRAKTRQLPNAYDVEDLHARIEEKRRQLILPFGEYPGAEPRTENEDLVSLPASGAAAIQRTQSLRCQCGPLEMVPPQGMAVATDEPCLSRDEPRATRQTPDARVRPSQRSPHRNRPGAGKPGSTDLVNALRSVAPDVWPAVAAECASRYPREHIELAIRYCQGERIRRRIDNFAGYLTRVIKTATPWSLRRAVEKHKREERPWATLRRSRDGGALQVGTQEWFDNCREELEDARAARDVTRQCRVLEALAEHHRTSGSTDSAIAHQEEAAQLSGMPHQLEALACLYAEAGRKADARRVYDDAIETWGRVERVSGAIERWRGLRAELGGDQ